ncbi:MAG: AI-2E family transporter [Firmicutes bacterium]|nr:AI-2E family transporter [Bacillota bacterium]
MESKKDEKFRQNAMLVILGVGLLVALVNLKAIMGVAGTVIGLFMPLIVGGVIAFVLNVPMHFFEKQIDRINERRNSAVLRKLRTVIGLVITLFLFVVVIYFIGKVIFPSLAEAVKTIADIIMTSYPGWIAAVESYGFDMSMVTELINKLDFASIMQNLKENFGNIIFTTGQAVGSVVSVVSNAGFGMVFAIYILLSKNKLGLQAKKLVYAYMKKEWADEICMVAELSHKTFSNFLSGQCTEAIILGSLFAVVLSIGGFPSAVAIAVIIGSMSLIPFVGAFIGMAFGILLISVEGLQQVIMFVVVFLIVQQIEGQIIYPRVVGGSVGLPPIWTLLAVVVGGSVSGIFGIILFIPLFSVLYALIRRNAYKRLRKKDITIE